MSLSEGHTFVLHSYLRFTSYKREQHAREVAQCVEDASDKLPDGVRLLSSSMQPLCNRWSWSLDAFRRVGTAGNSCLHN
jgi:hypothetical protein